MLPDGTLGLCYEKELQFYGPTGSLIGTLRVPEPPRSIIGMGQLIFVGLQNSISTILLDSVAPQGLAAGINFSAGPLTLRTEVLNVAPTSMAVDGDRLYVVCGRHKDILCFRARHNGSQLSLQTDSTFRWFVGARPDAGIHSISVPSPGRLVIACGMRHVIEDVVLLVEGLATAAGPDDAGVRIRVLQLAVPRAHDEWYAWHEVIARNGYLFVTG